MPDNNFSGFREKLVVSSLPKYSQLTMAITFDSNGNLFVISGSNVKTIFLD
jgi:hypothetical protein